MNTSKKASLLVIVLAWFTCLAPSFAQDDGRTWFGGQESGKGDHNRGDGRGGGDEHGRKAGCENTDNDERDRDRDKDRDRTKHGDDDDCQCEQAPATEIDLGGPGVTLPNSSNLGSIFTVLNTCTGDEKDLRAISLRLKGAALPLPQALQP